MFHIPLEAGPVNLKLRGVEGRSNEEILAEINRGGRFVIYQYAISALVISFRRPSDIHFIPPGRSALLPGLRYSLLSVLLGWWGFPWGIIYTIGALTRNFSGGVDVTADLARALAPDESSDSGFTQAAASQLPAAPTLREPAHSGRNTTTRPAQWLVGTLVVGTLAAIVFLAFLTYYNTSYPLAIVNGTSQPYTVALDGKDHQLDANSARTLKVSTGAHTIAATLPNGASYTREFVIGSGWLDFSTRRHNTILNPDRLALIIRQHHYYTQLAQEPSANEMPRPRVWVGDDLLTLPRPDFFFKPFPDSIAVSSNSTLRFHFRSQIAAVPEYSVAERSTIVLQMEGAEAMSRYADTALAYDPHDERLLRSVGYLLPSTQAQTLLARHLNRRPPPILLHRWFQWIARLNGDETLVARYDAMLQREPDNTGLIYLRGRLEGSRKQRESFFLRATEGAAPSSDALLSLAVLAMTDGNFMEALALCDRASAIAPGAQEIDESRMEALICLERWDELAAIARAQFERSPLVENASTVLAFLVHGGRSDDADAFLTSAEARLCENLTGETQQQTRDRLQAAAAELQGDVQASGTMLCRLGSPYDLYAGSLLLRDHRKAAEALAAFPKTSPESFFLLYLLALQSSDSAEAENYFNQGLHELSTWSASGAKLVQSIQNGASEPSWDDIYDTLETPQLSAIRLVAFGCRYPAVREQCFARARLFIHRHDGATRILRAVLHDAAAFANSP